MRRGYTNRFGLAHPRQIPATAALAILLVSLSVVGAVVQRVSGFGTNKLVYSIDGLFDLELWRLVTYPLVQVDAFNLLLNVLVMWFFCGWFETTYGRRDFLRFFFSSAVGAAILAIPLTMLINFLLPLVDPGMNAGPGPVFDAMLVALALTSPNSNILFGFVLPMRARTAIYILLGVHLIFGLMSGISALGIALGGMAMGYLLITGNWRPSRWGSFFRRPRRQQSRRGLYVVPPKDDETLH